MAIDIPKFFNDELPKQLATKSDAISQLGGVYQINVTGEGEWILDASIQPPQIHAPKDWRPAECTLIISGDQFQHLIEHPGRATALFFQGGIKVEGDPRMVMKLLKIFTLARAE